MSNVTGKKPVFLLAGGRGRSRKTPDPLIQAVLTESGKTSPLVAYVGTASGEDAGFFGYFAGMLREMGAGRIDHALIASERADLDKARQILGAADIIFISGGDVERGMQGLHKKGMASFLSCLYQQGKLFFGISAGSIMLARKWIRWRDPDDDSTAELFPCLGLAPIICDTHGEEDGWQELKALLMLERDGVKGYGIVSGTALKVFPDGKVEALGGAVHQFARHGESVKRLADVLP